jgi:hypothetical protein
MRASRLYILAAFFCLSFTFGTVIILSVDLKRGDQTVGPETIAWAQGLVDRMFLRPVRTEPYDILIAGLAKNAIQPDRPMERIETVPDSIRGSRFILRMATSWGLDEKRSKEYGPFLFIFRWGKYSP